MHIIMLRFYGELTSRIAIDRTEPESKTDASGGDPVREVVRCHNFKSDELKDSVYSQAKQLPESG